MGNRDAIPPVVIRLANREITYRVVCGSVPGEYELWRRDSLAGSRVVGLVSMMTLNADARRYRVSTYHAWIPIQCFFRPSLADVLQSALAAERGEDISC